MTVLLAKIILVVLRMAVLVMTLLMASLGTVMVLLARIVLVVLRVAVLVM